MREGGREGRREGVSDTVRTCVRSTSVLYTCAVWPCVVLCCARSLFLRAGVVCVTLVGAPRALSVPKGL